MPRAHKYQDRDPQWTHNHESRYQRGRLFGNARSAHALTYLSLVDALVTSQPVHDGGIRQIDLKESVTKILETLTPREKYVVTRVLGLAGYTATSAAKLAKEGGVHSTTILNVYHGAIRKMRHPARAKYLRDFVAT